ncbi:hypothetical protein M406DRAFT_340580 [Cryphonectria parasitica EP155]|uniref:Rhodopsin domain-containing protein n=1 Tax=Cryphonectria parasitica (strain ATCC 38755 / EP155) TaxID=660469 RepID=A0A9P4Y270_CRYP1|nr:uncharacterized protein M406DRAFT_340580 [Cryphonectria parasitica EP155]KAF3765113.1 hypothetical protein M406DRAFT_340580 [Cryphonectria parasitica EP155]
MAVENTGPEQVSTTAVLLALATVFTVLRFWARYQVVAKYGLDDSLLVAGLIGVFVVGGLNFGMVNYGMGRHADTLSLDQLEEVLKRLLAFECVYVTTVALVKLSILSMYLRIFPSRDFKIGAYTIGSIVIAWCIAIVLVSIFQCDPIEKAWIPWMTTGTCINLRASFIGNGVPNILTDVAILAMPVKQVWHLHATMAQKISLLCTFGLGSFVLVASIYRFSTLMSFNEEDTTFTLATPCTWCVVESACGVICANLPTLRPLAKKFSNKFGSSEKSRSRTNGSLGPTELVTIGRSQQMNSRITRTKSPFERLDDESSEGDAYDVPTRNKRLYREDPLT